MPENPSLDPRRTVDYVASPEAPATVDDAGRARAEARFRVGLIRLRLGELKETEKDFDQALLIQKQLAAEFPSRPDFRLNLANSLQGRGLLLSEAGRSKEAEQDYDQAVSIYKQLAAEFSNLLNLRNDLAAT